jgi:SAM-dependent methyltransferase
MMFGTKEAFTYAACAACGTLRLLGVPADMSRFYGNAYYATRRDFRRWVRRHHSVYRLAHLLMTRRLPDLPGWWPAQHRDRATRVLDVGSGAGNLLLRLKSLGFANLLGIDPFNPKDIDYGRGLTIKKQRLDLVTGEFEVVVMNHSFEHMPNPLAALEQARMRLAPVGVLVIRTPVAGSWAMREYGADWVQLDAPRHLFVHSEQGLRCLAAAAGLTVDGVGYDSNAMQFWGSEQYRRGIPFSEGQRLYSRRELRELERRAQELNRESDGDQAWFHLSPAGPRV